jgi:hypothetical protein
MPYLEEDPFGIVTDVYWKKGEPPPPRPAHPHYCGYYGWGMTVQDAVAVGFGDNQYPPMIGETYFDRDNEADGLQLGGVYNSNYIPDVWLPSGVMQGTHAASLLLLLEQIVFTNVEIYFGPSEGGGGSGDVTGPPAIFWTVPMSGGETYLGYWDSGHMFTPWVPLKYTINMDWVLGGHDTGELGLGFSRGIGPQGYTDPINSAPSEPQIVLGPLSEGSGSYTYETKMWEWYTDEVSGKHHYTYETQWDLSSGGPVYVFLMTGISGVWTATNSLFGFAQAEGDQYTWEVVAECGNAFDADDIGTPPIYPPDHWPPTDAGPGTPALLQPPPSRLSRPGVIAPGIFARIDGLYRELAKPPFERWGVARQRLRGGIRRDLK